METIILEGGPRDGKLYAVVEGVRKQIFARLDRVPLPKLINATPPLTATVEYDIYRRDKDRDGVFVYEGVRP